MKKLLSLIMAMAMALSCLCSGALAAELSVQAPEEASAVASEEAPQALAAAAEAAPETEDAVESEEVAEDEDAASETEDTTEPEAAPETEDAVEPEKAEALQPQAETQYVLMNIPYDKFYEAEGVSNQVDAVSSATKNKTRTANLAGGSYHVNSDGSDITGVIYPVKADPAELSGYTQITDDSTLEITVTNRGKTTTDTFTGKDALFEAPSYAYYVLSETPEAYKELENGKFSAVQGVSAQKVEAAAAVDPTGHHTDIEIPVEGFTLPTEEKVSGAIVTTSEGKSYGMRHVTEVWRNGFSIGWNYDQEGFNELTGKTLTKLTYITQKGVYEMAINVKVPEYVYALMNIPYDEFYKAELAQGSVDVVSAATAVKSRNKGLAGGSYHAADSQGVDGVVYPVKVDKADLSGLTEVTDSTSITVSYNNRGDDMSDTWTGKDALFEAPAYAYYLLSEKPALSKVATLTDGKWSFTAVSGRAVASEAELTMSTGGHHTYYEFSGPSVLAQGETLNAVVLTTEDGKTYGLRHVTEIWRNGLQLGWDETDGYEGLSGATITKITYLTTEHKYEVSTKLYVPINVSTDLTVADALATAGRTEISSTLPADFEAEMAVKDHPEFQISGNSITFPTDASIGAYTLSVTDKSGKYAPFTVGFELKTDKVLSVYDEKAKALAAAEGVSAEDFSAFLKGISTVRVNERTYNASGRGAVVIVKEDGSLDLTAAGVTENKVYQFAVHAPGYDDVTFSIDQRQPQTLSVTTSYNKKMGDKAFTLSVKGAQAPVSYSSGNTKVATVNAKGKVTIKGVGKAEITVDAEDETHLPASATVTVTVAKGSQPMTVSASAKSVKVKAVKKKAQSVSALTVNKNQGSVSYSVIGGNSKSKKALSVNKKTGKVTVKKGTKKGKYTVKVKVAAKGNSSYKSGSKTVSVSVTVK